MGQADMAAQVTDAGCATLAAGLNNGALLALEGVYLFGTHASAAAKAACGWHWQNAGNEPQACMVRRIDPKGAAQVMLQV